MINNRLVRTLLGVVLTKAAVVGAWYLYQAKFDAKDQDFKDGVDKRLDEEFGPEKESTPKAPETEKIVTKEVKARQAKKEVAPKKVAVVQKAIKKPRVKAVAKPEVVKEAPAKAVRKPRIKKSV